jgi:Spy/CpxP family protein refolding chaperone
MPLRALLAVLAVLAALGLPTPPAEGGAASPVAGSAAHPPEVPGLAPAEVAQLLEGRGMGLARVADVLGYPGPRHVLDAWAAGQLALAPAQASRVEAIFATMAADARRLGAQVVDAEQALARALRDGGIDPSAVDAHAARIGALRGALRAVHLRAHLETRAALDPAQLARYAELRAPAREAGGAGHGH